MATEGQSEAVEKHGGSGYRKGCRCDVCRAAKRAYGQEERRKRMAAVAAGEADFVHGYEGYTRWGCRCEVCRGAKSAYQSGRGRGTGQKEYMRKYRQGRKVDVTTGAREVDHGLSGYTNDGCRCETCTESMRAYQAANPEKRFHVRHPDADAEMNRRRIAKWQAETLESANRYGLQWTGPELEIASRTDLTAREAALLIGRTYASVKTMRKKLGVDPKTINVAGIPRGAASSSDETGGEQ